MRKHRKKTGYEAFTLVEMLVVIAIIGVLLGLLLPALKYARLKARIAKVHVELRDLSAALETYYNNFQTYPPAKTQCGPDNEDHHEYPKEVSEQHYIDSVPKDVFNTGPTYKYIAPGKGWVNGWPQDVIMWVPRNYPDNDGSEDTSNSDVAYTSQIKSPVSWALWSVGPYGPLAFWESGLEHVPVPRRTWYEPGKKRYTKDGTPMGVITRLSNGKCSP